MENIISKFLSEISFIAVTSLVVITVKNIIDNRNLTELEKLLMTNWTKFKMDLSNYGAYTFILLSIGIIYTTFYNPSALDSISPSIVTNILAFILVWIILTLGFIFLFNSVTWIDQKLSSHNDFFIKLDNNENWKIIKMKNETSILVKKDNKYMFIDDWSNKMITSQPNNHFPLKIIYKLFPNASIMNKIIFPIVLSITLISFILCIIFQTIMMFPLFFFIVFLILTIVIVWIDFCNYTSFNNQQN